MKKAVSFFGILMLVFGIMLSSCGREKEKSDHESEVPSGASFKAGKGVMLTDETRQILGLEVVDVTEEELPQVVELSIQIFGEKHRPENLDRDHTGCDIHGSGFLPADKAALVEAGQAVKLKTSQNKTLDGFVVKVQKPLVQGETEIIIGVTTADTGLKDGEFASASISMPRTKPVKIIPGSALLRTVMGTFVYAVNGNAYYRTAVTTGGSAEGKVEITEGLYTGDQVVAKPVETLWLIELRATKGGGHCH